MTGMWDWSPAQQPLVDQVAALAPALGGGSGTSAARALLQEGRLLAPDLPTDWGGQGGTLLQALTVAEALGRHLPRAASAALLDGAPVRLLRLLDRARDVLEPVLSGAAGAGLVDGTDGTLRLERRGNTVRLQGDVPSACVPRDARHLLFVLGTRGEPSGVALVPLHHASLRSEPVAQLPLQHLGGVLDVELGEHALWEGQEVARALAMEELVRGARAQGEVVAAALENPTTLKDDVAACAALWAARTGLYAAAERLWDGGPHTLLGADTRMGPWDSALEARAMVRTALADALAVVLRVLPLHPARVGLALDVALLGSPGLRSSPFLRLGEARAGLGAASVRPRLGSSVPRAADSRTPLPDAAVTEVGEPRRMAARPAPRAPLGGGPLPFVPDPWRPAQREARALMLELLEPACAAAREGAFPEGVLEALAGRSWLGRRVDLADAASPPSPPMLLAAAEEWGRLPPTVACSLLDTALAAQLLEACGATAPSLALATGRDVAALTLGGPPIWSPATTHVVRVGTEGLTLHGRAAGVDAPALWAGGTGAQALEARAWLELLWAARRLGLCGHVLEVWRATVHRVTNDPGPATFIPLGQAWARLAETRALLWTTAAAPQSAWMRRCLLHRAVTLHEDTLEQALAACGPESVRPGHALARHLEALAALNGLMRT